MPLQTPPVKSATVVLDMWLDAENTGQTICGESIPEPSVGDGQGVHMASW